MNLDTLLARVRVIATSVITLFTSLAAGITLAVNEIAPQLPEGWQDDAFKWAAIVTGVLVSAIAALRKVTPVPADQVGVLPQSVEAFPQS